MSRVVDCLLVYNGCQKYFPKRWPEKSRPQITSALRLAAKFPGLFLKRRRLECVQ